MLSKCCFENVAGLIRLHCNLKYIRQWVEFWKKQTSIGLQVVAQLTRVPYHGTKNKLSFDAQKELFRITGVDLTEILGIEASTALRFISETGLDFTRWRNTKQFASWLGLCPGNKVSGGKSLSGKTTGRQRFIIVKVH